MKFVNFSNGAELLKWLDDQATEYNENKKVATKECDYNNEVIYAEITRAAEEVNRKCEAMNVAPCVKIWKDNGFLQVTVSQDYPLDKIVSAPLPKNKRVSLREEFEKITSGQKDLF